MGPCLNIEIGSHAGVVWSAKPTCPAIREAIRQTLHHPDYWEGMPIVCEARQSGYNPPVSEVQAIAQALASYRERLGPIALVVHSTLHFGPGNMLYAYCKIHGVTLGVFYDREEGLAWACRRASTPRARYLEAGA